MATGYRIFLKNGVKGVSLDNDGDFFDITIGHEEVREDGFLLGTSHKECFSYIDIPEAGEQIVVTYEFDPEQAGKEDGDGDIKVFKATVQDVEDLVPEITDNLPIEERLSYDQLTRISEPKRKVRAQNEVRGPALEIEPDVDSQYLWFNFKSYPSTTGLRHRGYSKFLKPRGVIAPDDFRPLEKVECIVDCTCPDYKFRWAWANKQRGSGNVGPGSLNQAFNRAPRKTNPSGAPGLCKHLLAMKDYIYGQSSNFPGGVPVAGGKMAKNVDFATKRWINFDTEVARAKERERAFRATTNQRRIGIGVPTTEPQTPETPPPLPGQDTVPTASNDVARLSQFQVPDAPPEIGQEPVPDTTSSIQPSFLNRMRDFISRGAGWLRNRFRRNQEPETTPEIPSNPPTSVPPELPGNEENPNQQESLVFTMPMKPLKLAISLCEEAEDNLEQAELDVEPISIDGAPEEEESESEMALRILGEIKDELVALNATFSPGEEGMPEDAPEDIDLDAPPTEAAEGEDEEEMTEAPPKAPKMN